MATTILEAKERIHEVRIEGLALLKIVKHCHESLPSMVTGSLLGMSNGNGALEVTHAFPFPDSSRHNKTATATTTTTTTTVNNHEGDPAMESGETTGNELGGMDGHEFQLEMMRMLREVNVDNNCVGWYQSMYLGIYSTSNLLENQLSYQTDLSPNAVVILYDPMQTANGIMVLKCYRLSKEAMNAKLHDTNVFIPPSKIFEEIPVRLVNPGLVRALLADISDGITVTGPGPFCHGNSFVGTNGLYDLGADTLLDSLDLSTNPYLEKHLEFLCGWVDDLASEQHKFQYYARQLARNDKREAKNRSRGGGTPKMDDAWASSEAPRRMESLLISNQIQSYVNQMETFSSEGLSKLYLMGGLHCSKAGETTGTVVVAGPSSD